MKPKKQTKVQKYLAHQASRGMVDVGTKRYDRLESTVCQELGEDLSPESIAQIVKIEGGTHQEARTISSNLGFNGDSRTEKALQRYFGKEYIAPEILGT